MFSLGGVFVMVVLLQSLGDAVERRSVRASWLNSAKLLSLLTVITAAGVCAGRLLR